MTHFSDQDITQIREHGQTIDAINQQMADFITGFPYTQKICPGIRCGNPHVQGPV